MKKVIWLVIVGMIASNAYAETDRQGRQIIRGPVSGSIYRDVHIISESTGVVSTGGGVTIIDSVIDAPVCVRSTGTGVTLYNNILNCDLCIEFIGSVITDNDFQGNECAGTITNRPDIFE